MRTQLSASTLCTSIAFAALFAGCTKEPEELQLSGATMGTTWSVRVANCFDPGCSRLGERISERLLELNKRLSHYEPDSELAGFNNYTETDWFPASAELATVVAYALDVSARTNGAFDVTVAPAVDAWGFGPGATSTVSRKPGDAQLAQAREHSGYSKLATRESPYALRKQDPQLRVNLSALAKGYAVDQIAYLIEATGNLDYMVEIGGEVRTSGFRPDGLRWRIGIQPPEDGFMVEYVVTPGEAALATSGDYRNYYMLDGERISHTINPVSGTPVDNNLASVSVIAPDAMQADALATAIMVMGARAGMEFAVTNQLPVLIIERTPDGMRSSRSPEFASYLL